jgi:hypothetical protein
MHLFIMCFLNGKGYISNVLMRPQGTRAIMNALLFPSEDIYYLKKVREPRLV